MFKIFVQYLWGCWLSNCWFLTVLYIFRCKYSHFLSIVFCKPKIWWSSFYHCILWRVVFWVSYLRTFWKKYVTRFLPMFFFFSKFYSFMFYMSFYDSLWINYYIKYEVCIISSFFVYGCTNVPDHLLKKVFFIIEFFHLCQK